MTYLKKHAQLALSLFFIAALLGLILRSISIASIEFEYRYLVHAHSHVALLGWVYFGLTTLISHFYLKGAVPKRVYQNIFWFTLITVIGMLATFPFTGYALFSIIFSTLFLIASYFYAWAFFKYTPNNKKNTSSYTITKYALVFMLISSIGPWAIGGVMATLGSESYWYRIAIYFYLHFQYNAWMVLGLIGIFLKILENNDIHIEHKLFNRFLFTFFVGIIFNFFLSVLFIEPHISLYILSAIGGIFQLFSFLYLYRFIRENQIQIGSVFGKIPWQLMRWSFILLLTKMLMQLIGSFQYTAKLAASYNYLTIGFLHLVFLGVVTIGLFALLKKAKLIHLNPMSIRLYILSFVLTEFIIFYQPAEIILNLPYLPNYNWWLFIASLLLVLSIFSIFIAQYIHTKDRH